MQINKLVDQMPIEFYYIVSGKCTECKGFHEEPQCAAVCPVDCCIPDPDYVEFNKILFQFFTLAILVLESQSEK